MTKTKITRTDQEWKAILSPEEYRVLREKGTERPFSGVYCNPQGEGQYQCAGCGQVLFASGTQFDAGCGWPSFWDALDPTCIVKNTDKSHGMKRTEVVCSQCDGHLGHVFDDGPKPTGERYCINSVSIKFKPNKS